MLLRPELFLGNELPNSTIKASPIRIQAFPTRPRTARPQRYSTRSTATGLTPKRGPKPNEPGGFSRPEPARSNRQSPRRGYIREGHPKKPLLETQLRDARAQDLVLQQLEEAVRSKKVCFPPHLQIKTSISDCQLNDRGELLYRGRR